MKFIRTFAFPATDMFMWTIILTLLLIGVALVVLEIVFIPGTTVVGLLGLAFAITGIVIAFSHLGRQTGTYVSIAVLIVMAVALFFSFRTGAWSRLALKSSIDSKVNEDLLRSLKIGDEGTTLSALRPMGKASFQEKIVEVKTSGNYLEQGTKVKITFLQANQIIVEPII